MRISDWSADVCSSDLLSAAREASVVRRFAEHGVAPDRLGIIGWGEQRPAASNDSAEGRNKNRRGLIVVLGKGRHTERANSDSSNGSSNPLGSQLPDAARPGEEDGSASWRARGGQEVLASVV